MSNEATVVSSLRRGAQRGVQFLRGLGRRNCLLVIVAVAAVALVLNPGGHTALGLSPLLISFLPCLAMCALGMCKKKGSGEASCSKSGSANVSQ